MHTLIVDGPPINRFTENGEVIHYKTVMLGSTGNFISLAKEFNKRLNALINAGEGRVIVWRQRPETRIDDNDDYFISARLSFYPELTKEVWDDNFKPKPEGGMCEFI